MKYSLNNNSPSGIQINQDLVELASNVKQRNSGNSNMAADKGKSPMEEEHIAQTKPQL